MNKQKIRDMIAAQEGRINHLYRDSKGFVTIGEGHLVACMADLDKLGFEPDELPALRLDWSRVMQAPPNLKASAYAKYTTCRLPEPAIDALTGTDIDKKVGEIRSHLSCFDTMPEPAQEAVFDIAYNTGVAGLMAFHHMIGALVAKDYAAAALASRRKPPVSEARNAATAKLFLDAATLA